jgi:hypothetical protein
MRMWISALDELLKRKRSTPTMKPPESPPEKKAKEARDIPNEVMDPEQMERSQEGKTAAEKNDETDYAASMKEKGHLFLQIAARWAEDSKKSSSLSSETESPEKKSPAKGERAKRQVAGQSQADDEHQDLNLDTDVLLEEFKRVENQAKLTKLTSVQPSLKTSASGNRATKATAKAKGCASSKDETDLIAGMGAAVVNRGEYEATLVDDLASSSVREGVHTPISDRLGAPATTATRQEKSEFGASAPGFVRSKKDRVTELEPPDDGQVEDESFPEDVIMLDQPDIGQGLLKREDLQRIQEQLAQDREALVAERGRRDRAAATVTDLMWVLRSLLTVLEILTPSWSSYLASGTRIARSCCNCLAFRGSWRRERPKPSARS